MCRLTRQLGMPCNETITCGHSSYRQAEEDRYCHLMAYLRDTETALRHFTGLLKFMVGYFYPPLSPRSLAGWGHLIAFTLLTSRRHPSRSSSILSHSRLLTSTLSTFLLTLSLRLKVGLPLLLLPSTSVYHALFVKLSSLIL